MTAIVRETPWRQIGAWGGALALLAGALLAFTYYQARHPGFASVAAAECAREYARARTAADTAAADGHRPLTLRGQNPAAMTCGGLRVTGELPRR